MVELIFGVGQVELAHVFDALHPLLLLLGNVVVGVVQVAQNLLVACFERLVFLVEVVQDITYAQTYAGSFVAVSRANALASGANLVLALCCLVGTIEHTVGRQNEVGAAADVQTLGQFIAGSFEFVGLGHKEVGGYHAAVANDIDFALVENA